MKCVYGVLLVPLVLPAVGGCGGARSRAAGPVRPEVAIPTEWSGVSFDEEVGLLDTSFEPASNAGEDCGNVYALEPVAMQGALTDAQITCLDHALRLSSRQTTKDTISRVLMADAWAKGDKHRWEGAARRHLQEIDQSDPDLAYVFAIHLSKKDVGSAFEAIRYADLALEKSDQWGPEHHAERVNTIYKLRALEAQSLWHYYEDEMLADRSPEVLEQVDRWRAAAKSMSREWLEFAYAAGADVVIPYEVCVSAAGSLGYCDIGFGSASDAE